MSYFLPIENYKVYIKTADYTKPPKILAKM